MNHSYNFVKSATREEFEKTTQSSAAAELEYMRSDAEDIRRIENLLDVQHGTLGTEPFKLEKMKCDCGRYYTMYDFVFTAIVDAEHSKSFLLHVLVGNKYVIQEPRFVRCSACGTVSKGVLAYGCSMYGCGP